MEGKLNIIKNGFYSYDIYEADQNYIYQIADILTKQHGFSMVNSPVIGLDCVYWDFNKNNIKLTLGWDIWSGAFIFAHCLNGNDYIKIVSDYFNNLFMQNNYDE
jgi:hypothetical protein